MNTKTKGIVAGVAGGALLLGAGGTFALWHDDAGVAGGTITAGKLDVDVQETRWYDVSPDGPGANDLANEVGAGLRWDAGQLGSEQTVWNSEPTAFGQLDADGPAGATSAVMGEPIDDLGSWAMVPGDFVLAQTRVTATAHGDNMRAVLSLDGLDRREGGLMDGLGVKVALADWDGTLTEDWYDVAYDRGFVLQEDSVREMQVFVLVTLPSTIDQQDLTGMEAVFDGLQVRLEQVR